MATIASIASNPPSKPNPNLVLAPVTIDDIPAMSPVWTEAFNIYPIMERMFPWTPAQQAWWDAANTRTLLHDPTVRLIKVVDTANHDKLAGYAQWYVPARNKEEEEKAKKVKEEEKKTGWCTDGDVEMLNNVFNNIEEEKEKIMEDRPHCFLHILCVHPTYQRQGASSLLLHWGCDIADATGIEAYLAAAPKAVPVYERFGFKGVNTAVQSGGFLHTFMLRPAKGKKESKECEEEEKGREQRGD
ncbi:MAG: hypothetical protein M1827_004436 [Pycnora praestabilis]|nr:MAG: hypothetical protein M1827_004436 [Pycnora praestabilis]